jgi:hypothetical protein
MTAADQAAVAEGCVFDLAAAERVRVFFRQFLRHSKGQWAGQPFELLPWPVSSLPDCRPVQDRTTGKPPLG